MSEELVAAVRRELLSGGLVDEDQPALRITEATVTAREGRLDVAVDFAQNDQRGQFERPFNEVDLQMLTEPTTRETAFAIATWVRLELVEYVSELTGEGRWKSEL